MIDICELSHAHAANDNAIQQRPSRPQ